MNQQERLNTFQHSMVAQAEAEIARLNKEMDALSFAREKRAKAQAEAGEAACIRTAKEQAAQIMRQQSASAATKLRQRLIRLRTELTNELFAQAMEELIHFTATDAYEKFLLSCVGLLRQAIPQPDAILFLRAEDMTYSKNCAQVWRTEIQMDPGIHIGGARAYSAQTGLIADETLDTRLEDQRIVFRLRSELILS